MAQLDWFYMRNGGSIGPERTDRLLELLDKGEIDRETLVWRQEMPDWQPLETALGLAAHVPPPLPGTPDSVEHPPIRKAQGFARQPLDYSPHPWRRYFARMLDTTISGALMFFLLGLILASIDQNAHLAFVSFLEGSGSQIFSAVLTTCLVMLPNAVCIGYAGTTLGKYIFGVAVQRGDGTPPGFLVALNREAMIWLRGLGLGIPIISLFTLISGYQTLKRDQQSSWDGELNLIVAQRPPSAAQTLFNWLGVGLWLVVLSALLGMSQ